MPSYIPIEDRYNYRKITERSQFNVFGSGIATVVGIAAGVGALGSVAGGIIQGQAAGKAAKSAEKLASQQTVPARARGIEQLLRGATAQRQTAMQITNQLMGGQIPKDVQQQIMRNVAEYAGAGFAPTTTEAPEGAAPISGFQSPQALLARQFGETSLGLQNLGMSYASSWQAQAMNFVNRVAADRIAAQTQAIGARYAADVAPAQMIQGVTSTIAGAGMGLGNIYGALGGAGGAGGLGGGGAGGVSSISAVSNPNTQYFARSLPQYS
jgi:hypothetical protein